VAKAIALGADVAALASPLLKAAALSAEAVVERIEEISQELRIAMFCIGAAHLGELRETPLVPLSIAFAHMNQCDYNRSR